MADQSKQSGSAEQAAPSDIQQMSFEDALAELKQIVERLEKGEGKLDEAIQAYERGAHLKRHCEQKLKEAEAKIEKIRVSGAQGDGSGGQVSTEPLDVQ
ncbi:exodeoxyribonuclease VII small subunit [Rhodovibrio salinarum]|uniref:Exodeoxyribonuclease 7 small subunit n=1 Tax=Rhodovibrio salinarum TaxID=1087 RepID=A0A934QGU6_9PROT|nr:exodeoxyribonuclease VII small subunit [Rhodovibrio salinarum]MBK1696634.1 exodeoxyribonuclease VII small subunit [Rhodovibrio salinarum]